MTAKTLASILTLVLLLILSSVALTLATSEDNYNNDLNILPSISEITCTENGYTINIILNPYTTGIFAEENGFNLDLTVNPQGIGGSLNENNYHLDLIPEKIFPEQPDLTITAITTSKTVVGQGYLLHINVTVQNQAYQPEKIQVTVYANTTVIQTQTITLPSKDTTIITYTWNTTGVAYDNYTISTYAYPIVGETFTVDNALIGDTVMVTIPGDINGDRNVNVLDLFAIGKAYSSIHDNPNWNPNANINCDGTINDLDLAIISENYGKI